MNFGFSRNFGKIRHSSVLHYFEFLSQNFMNKENELKNVINLYNLNVSYIQYSYLNMYFMEGVTEQNCFYPFLASSLRSFVLHPITI